MILLPDLRPAACALGMAAHAMRAAQFGRDHKPARHPACRCAQFELPCKHVVDATPRHAMTITVAAWHGMRPSPHLQRLLVLELPLEQQLLVLYRHACSGQYDVCAVIEVLLERRQSSWPCAVHCTTTPLAARATNATQSPTRLCRDVCLELCHR